MKKFLGILLIYLLSANIVIARTNDFNIIRPDLYSYEEKINLEQDTLKKHLKNDFLINNQTGFNEKVMNFSILPAITNLMPTGIIYQEEYKPVDYINPQKTIDINSAYPGLRGPNQLIVYTPSFGLRTGTNEYGTEAIVENNMVVRLNGADSIIPLNGFVISGHGKSKNWILKNIQIGSKVYIDYANNSIKVYLTPESLLFAAKEKQKDVKNVIAYYNMLDRNYNNKKAIDCINNSDDLLKRAEKRPEKTQSYITEAMQSLEDAMKNAIPYYHNEMKGIWIRPVETTPSDIEKTIKRIHNAGITDIFLETYFHGKTIYPSKYLQEKGVTSQREEFVGFDPLDIWIKEAHKRNMKVHIWFETFYLGNENPKLNKNNVLNVYPTWVNKRRIHFDSIEPVPSLSEHNGYFLDPANIQVQAYLKGILNEIITKYKPDGINLDYIRYPQTVDSSYSNYAETNWGYTQFARNDFKEIYGIDPINIEYGTGDWELWAQYRQNKISQFVSGIRDITKNSNIKLTTVIFPDLQKSKITKMQDWRVWSMNNYVDGFTPLLLTGDKNTANLLMKDVKRNTSISTNIYPGIFVTFMGGTIEDLLLQIHTTREYKTKGQILFDYAHLDDKYVEALTTRVFNESYNHYDKRKNNYDTIGEKDKSKSKKKSKKRLKG